jgi:hypothetical protein
MVMQSLAHLEVMLMLQDASASGTDPFQKGNYLII